MEGIFKPKMRKMRLRAARATPRTQLEELTALPQTLYC